MPQSLIGLRFFYKFLPENIERKDVRDDKRNLQGDVGRQIIIRELSEYATKKGREDRV